MIPVAYSTLRIMPSGLISRTDKEFLAELFYSFLKWLPKMVALMHRFVV
jgi:hypothetical protein